MKSALSELDEITASYISVFQHSVQPSKADFKELLEKPEWSLEENENLWKCAGHTYQSWVCKFVYALLLRTTSAILQACHSMVGLISSTKSPATRSNIDLRAYASKHSLRICHGRSNFTLRCQSYCRAYIRLLICLNSHTMFEDRGQCILDMCDIQRP